MLMAKEGKKNSEESEKEQGKNGKYRKTSTQN
jgi:hypothetical protein